MGFPLKRILVLGITFFVIPYAAVTLLVLPDQVLPSLTCFVPGTIARSVVVVVSVGVVHTLRRWRFLPLWV